MREGLAASTRLIRQRPRSPFLLRLVRVKCGASLRTGSYWLGLGDGPFRVVAATVPPTAAAPAAAIKATLAA